MSVYVLTREHNDYDQHGHYLVAVFSDSPSPDRLRRTLLEEGIEADDAFLRHLYNGGGRINTEECWYYLRPLEFDKVFDHD